MYEWTTYFDKGLEDDSTKAEMISCRSRVIWSKSLELCATMDGVIEGVYLPFEIS